MQFVTLGVWLLCMSAFGSAPEPLAVQPPDLWTLNVKYEIPRQIVLNVPGSRQPQRFWYLIVSLTNDSGFSEVSFFPRATLMTDNFELIDAGQGVPAGVFQAIQQRHRGSYPFLESLDFKDNRIRQGADNTRDFVFIWRDFNAKAAEVSFFIGGLSNETAVLVHPLETEADGSPKRLILQKTLQLTYRVGADAQLRDKATLDFVGQRWVMR